MSKLSNQQFIVDNLRHATKTIKKMAKEEQRITHKTHICPHYQKVLDELDVKRVYEEILLMRIEITGK